MNHLIPVMFLDLLLIILLLSQQSLLSLLETTLLSPLSVRSLSTRLKSVHPPPRNHWGYDGILFKGRLARHLP